MLVKLYWIWLLYFYAALGRAAQVDTITPRVETALVSVLESKTLSTAFNVCFRFQHAPLHLAMRENVLRANGRGVHSSTYHLNVSTFGGIRRVVLVTRRLWLSREVDECEPLANGSTIRKWWINHHYYSMGMSLAGGVCGWLCGGYVGGMWGVRGGCVGGTWGVRGVYVGCTWG